MKSVMLGILTLWAASRSLLATLFPFTAFCCLSAASLETPTKGLGYFFQEAQLKDLMETSVSVLGSEFFVIFPDKEINKEGLQAVEKTLNKDDDILSVPKSAVNFSEVTEERIIHLYHTAMQYHMTDHLNEIIKEGMRRKDNTSFLFNHYLANLMIDPAESRGIKKIIRKKQGYNIQTEWELAVATFLLYQEKELSLAACARPMSRFLRKFDDLSSEYIGKAHLLLADFYERKWHVKKAKYHLQKALDCPLSESIKNQIERKRAQIDG